MQLNVSRTTRSLLRRVLTPLALCLCVTPALAGVLPDDRTDALYHRYEGGGITVQGPSILVQKKITDNFALTGNWYQDYISSASVDVTGPLPIRSQRLSGWMPLSRCCSV